ncbi:MAG: hypothetical protein ABIU08_09455 [Acidimicrobiales bacterium]
MLLRNHKSSGEAPPEPPLGVSSHQVRPIARNVRITLEADLGSIVAAIDTRLEFGDEKSSSEPSAAHGGS